MSTRAVRVRVLLLRVPLMRLPVSRLPGRTRTDHMDSPLPGPANLRPGSCSVNRRESDIAQPLVIERAHYVRTPRPVVRTDPAGAQDGPVRWTVIDSPIGDLSLAVDADGLCGVRFGSVGGSSPQAGNRWLLTAQEELVAYFAGELTTFSVPLSVPTGARFERAVWAQLGRIPYGGMQTYGDVAKVVGDPGAARAVGVACNRNPLPIVVPCHRVVGAGAKLVGFGGGLDRKRHLLELEARVTLETAWL